MTFERQPKQPQEKLEMREMEVNYYAVKNNSCHTFTIETYNDGETWIVSATGNEYNEAWLAEAALENMLMDRGYQVFYEIEEAEDFLREMDCDTEGELNLPQAEETSEQRDETTEGVELRDTVERLISSWDHYQPCDETPEEKELLDTVERLILSPSECVYYNGTNYSFRKRSWQDICLVAYFGDIPCMVVDLGQWARHDALDAIRSLHERLATV